MSARTPREAAERLHDWSLWRRPAQTPPEGGWRCWLFMGGRGAGKTRAGAEWVRARVAAGARRIALVGPTLSDVREVMVEGPSGVRAVHPDWERPAFEPSRRRLVWPCGAEAFGFSAEDPDSLRGPQFDAAWCDEAAAWAQGEAVFDTLMLALRLGERPACMVTTTPRPTALIRRLVRDAAEGRAVLTRAASAENAAHLAEGFIEAVGRAYAGTRLARQELEGELIEDPPGALWTRTLLDAARRPEGGAAGLRRVVVAVDPPAGEGARADACGIVAAGLGEDGVVHVLRDASARGLSPADWAGRAAALAADVGAGEIVAEANQGGAMVREVLRTAGGGAAPRVRLVHAVRSKFDRAQPVSALYAAGRVVHHGLMRALEDEMCAFGAEGGARGPDRVDALVWAVTALAAPPAAPPRVRGM